MYQKQREGDRHTHTRTHMAKDKQRKIKVCCGAVVVTLAQYLGLVGMHRRLNTEPDKMLYLV